MQTLILGRQYDFELTLSLFERAEDGQSHVDVWDAILTCKDHPEAGTLALKIPQPISDRFNGEIPQPVLDDVINEMVILGHIEKNESVRKFMHSLGIPIEDLFRNRFPSAFQAD